MSLSIDSQKKIGITTHFYNSINYGGVLQSYALVKILSAYNINAKQISYKQIKKQYVVSFIKSRISSVLSDIKTPGKRSETLKHSFVLGCKLCPFILKYPYRRYYLSRKLSVRRDAFSVFVNDFIPHTKAYYNDTISEAVGEADIFITGSDQVWNPNWYHDAYYLTFAPDDARKISYAASLGVDSLSDEEISRMKPLISRFDAVSVREERAIALLKSVTDKEVTHVLDPTLLLSESEWNEVAAERVISEPYILSYMLGGNKNNRRCVKSFAKRSGLKLVTLPFVGSDDMGQIWFGDVKKYGGPDEFIALIRDAECIITDSFHGCVFATIFHKKFAALKRNADGEKASMNSRLYSLFAMLGLEDRLVSSYISYDDLRHCLDSVSFKEVDIRLASEREKSINWLLKALE